MLATFFAVYDIDGQQSYDKLRDILNAKEYPGDHVHDVQSPENHDVH